MRTELYADSRDEWKWSVAIRHARESGQTIFWAVMLRPTTRFHGNDRKVVEGALPEVSEFFARERAFHEAGHPKSLSRVTKLCSEMGIELFSNMEAYPSTLARREHYVTSLIQALEARQPNSKYFVLLDPDNGIGESESRGEQIHTSHLQCIWNCTREGDTLALVQFQHYIGNWVVFLRERIAQVLAVDVSRVRSYPWDNLCLYLIDRLD